MVFFGWALILKDQGQSFNNIKITHFDILMKAFQFLLGKTFCFKILFCLIASLHFEVEH